METIPVNPVKGVIFTWSATGMLAFTSTGEALDKQDGFEPAETHKLNDGGSVTVKLVRLVPVPAGVVTAIGPVVAPLGTVAVICVAAFTVKVVAATPPKVTAVAPVKFAPRIVTVVPTPPLGGENEEITGAGGGGGVAERVKEADRENVPACAVTGIVNDPADAGDSVNEADPLAVN